MSLSRPKGTKALQCSRPGCGFGEKKKKKGREKRDQNDPKKEKGSL